MLRCHWKRPLAGEFEVRLTRSAARDLQKLPPDARGRVRTTLEALQTDPRLGKALIGELKGLWLYRTASYRLIYQLREAELVVLVVAIGHRRDIYEKARRRHT